MGYNDYGKTPNVWRPAEVEPLNTGADTGVGQQPRFGTETTTSVTETGIFGGGWVKQEEFASGLVVTSTSIVTIQQLVFPGSAAEGLVLVWFSVHRDSGGNPDMYFQISHVASGTLITTQLHQIITPNNDGSAWVLFHLGFNANFNNLRLTQQYAAYLRGPTGTTQSVGSLAPVADTVGTWNSGADAIAEGQFTLKLESAMGAAGPPNIGTINRVVTYRN